MVYCPACEADMDLDEEQLTEGGVVSCGGCGAHFEVVNPHPLELEKLGGDDDEDEDDEEDEDFDEDLDEDEEDDEDDEDEEDDDEEGYDDESGLGDEAEEE
ncbi:MAG TPA: hypothetical protein VMV31_00335 [Terriglobales bacterium]|nr:hypothetical protein [Terriglobales bacterium]